MPKWSYEFPMFSVTVDCVVFGLEMTAGRGLEVLLMQRENEPFADSWALPGGFVGIAEAIEEAALRKLKQKTGLKDVYLEQLYTFGAPGRDPRGRVVSCAYYALARPHRPSVEPGSLSLRAQWFSVDQLPELAFDHGTIFAAGLKRLRGKLSYTPIGIELLTEEFTLPDLQSMYEAILGRTLDRRNFRRKILETELLVELSKQRQPPQGGRPASVYRFDRKRYKSLQQSGFVLAI
jgi:8-oxo-dGTP diphosphatase